MQHIDRSSHATHCVLRDKKGQDSSAVKYDGAEPALILAVFHCMEPLTEGRKETGVPGEKP